MSLEVTDGWNLKHLPNLPVILYLPPPPPHPHLESVAPGVLSPGHVGMQNALVFAIC